MKTGEKAIYGSIVVLFLGSVLVTVFKDTDIKEEGKIPFYSTASNELQQHASQLMKELDCRSCHSIWTVRNPMRSVPAPPLDGLGSLRDEQWFYEYFSAQDPQSIIPSRLKEEYRMPSYAHLAEEDRRTLAAFMSSLKVEDWYLEETRKREYEKLTGKPYPVSEAKQP
jgi:hypothetical protein